MNEMLFAFLIVIVILIIVWGIIAYRIRKGLIPAPDEIGSWKNTITKKSKIKSYAQKGDYGEMRERMVKKKLLNLYTTILLTIGLVLSLFLVPIITVSHEVVADVDFETEYISPAKYTYQFTECAVAYVAGNWYTYSTLLITNQDIHPIIVVGFINISGSAEYSVKEFNVTIQYSNSFPQEYAEIEFDVPFQADKCVAGITWAYAYEDITNIIYEVQTERISLLEAMCRGYNPYV